MIRTQKSIKFTYVNNKIDEAGNVTAELKEIEVMENDPQKALKKAYKQVGLFVPLKTEDIERKYFLEDETFFKLAKVVGDE